MKVLRFILEVLITGIAALLLSLAVLGDWIYDKEN